MSALYTVAAPVGFTFGSFDFICSQVGLSLCSLVTNREPTCYSRNIDINSLLIFEPSTLIAILVALIMTAVMISNIKFKYTAVGRKEILLFFYLYAATLILEFFSISGIVPLSSTVFPFIVAIHTGLIITTFWALFLNGFVPFQFIEDGTRLSLLVLSQFNDRLLGSPVE